MRIFLILLVIQLECKANTKTNCICQYLHNQIGASRSVSLLISDDSSIHSIDKNLIKFLSGIWPIQIKNLASFVPKPEIDQDYSKDIVWISNDFLNLSEIERQKEFFETETIQMNSLHMISTNLIKMDELKSIFELFFDIFGANVNILVPFNGKLLWYSPIQDKSACLAEKKVTIRKVLEKNSTGICEMNDPNRNDEKVKCKIRIIGIHSPPFVYFDDVKGFYKGLEYYAIDAIVKKLEIDVEYTFLSNMTEYNQIIDPHGVFNHLAVG